jgi:probable addiction module antidote protein
MGRRYRVCFVRRGIAVILLLSGGDKRTQDRDIAAAKRMAVQVQDKSMTLKTIPRDSADHLTSAETITAYLDAAFEDGDPGLIRSALGDVARAKGMTEIAEATGLSRTSLYKALSPDGNPEFATVVSVLRSLGLRVGVRSAA